MKYYINIGDKKRKYLVEEILVIEDTNWDNLKDTDDNRITLITCVEDAPMYRRCVQAVEEKESNNEKNEEIINNTNDNNT